MTTEADAFSAALRARLDAARDAGVTIDLWWRDDDAIAPSDALDTVLATADRFDVPIALAVIPEPATPELGTRLETASGDVTVLQHGFAHRNYAPQGEKASELGIHRPAGLVLDELLHGRRKLETLFGHRFLPVLTPPWNRICDEVALRRDEIGLTGLSTFAVMHADDPDCVNTHIDVIDWKGGRRFAGHAKMTAIVTEEIDQRIKPTGGRTGREPLGLLTHHLDHDDDAWAFLDTFLSVAVDHSAVRWPAVGSLFS